MSLFQLSPGRHIPPYGHGKRQQSYRDAEIPMAFVQTPHQLPRGGDFTTGTVVWESGSACICPFFSKCLHPHSWAGQRGWGKFLTYSRKQGQWSWCVSDVLSLHGSPVAPGRAWHTHTHTHTPRDKFQLLHLGIVLHLSSNFCLLRIHR